LEFANVLAEVARFLDEEHARFGLAGAVALNAYGLARATTDLDLVVEEKAQPALLRFLASLGYEQLQVSAGFSSHLHPDPAWGRLDFIYLDDHTADVLFARATRARPLGNLEVLVPSPAHLAAMKVQAMHNDPSRRFQDLADVQFLLGLPGVDEEEIRGYFERQGMLDSFNELKRAMAHD
jgi:hypothetical protein